MNPLPEAGGKQQQIGIRLPCATCGSNPCGGIFPQPPGLSSATTRRSTDLPPATTRIGILRCRNGAACEAAEIVETVEPDIVLSDLDMPLMDGFDLARHVRLASLPDRPYMVALSSTVSTDVHERVCVVGFDSYLPKPVDFNMLLALVDEYARRQAI